MTAIRRRVGEPCLVVGGERNIDPFLLKLLANPLEFLVVRERDRPSVTQDDPTYSIGLWATTKGLSAEIQVHLLTVKPTVEFYDVV